MHAVVIHAPHDLRIETVATPGLGPYDVEVRIRAGGICGSDLHYYHQGGFGTVKLLEAMILGHEIAGEIVRAGPAVTTVRAGDRVAVDPSRSCRHCRFCLMGTPRHCENMLFYGSAMRFPHVQGGFRERLVCHEQQAVPLPSGFDFGLAALAEPLAVCLHAAGQAGSMLGRRVLITGAGPIGALCVLVARHAGAREVVVTDLMDPPLAITRRLGADLTINMAVDPGGLDRFRNHKGHFDVVLEASGSGAAIASALHVARPGATLVQVGLGGDVQLPLNLIVAKEIQVRGTFRFDQEFAWAVAMLTSGAVDVTPLITATLPMADALRAFDLASDRSQSMKVQLAF